MKRLSKSHSDSFAIYREKWGTMATLGLISVGIAAFGGFMIFLAGDKGASAPPFWFGWGLVILGAGILVTAIPYFRNMLREGHALEARVDLAGLTVAPALSSLLVQYPWAHVVGIDLIATLSLRDDEGRRRRYGCSAGPTRSARPLVVQLSHVCGLRKQNQRQSANGAPAREELRPIHHHSFPPASRPHAKPLPPGNNDSKGPGSI